MAANTKFDLIRFTNGYRLIYYDKTTSVKAELNFTKEGNVSVGILSKLLKLGLLQQSKVEEALCYLQTEYL